MSMTEQQKATKTVATLVVSNSLEELDKLRPFLDDVVDVCKVSKETVDSLNLALEEAMSNVMLYAYPKGHIGQIRLDAIMSEDKNILAFVLSDCGVAFDPTLQPPADITLSADERQIGGLGIFLIKNIMDEVTYRRIDGCNELTMQKKIRLRNPF